MLHHEVIIVLVKDVTKVKSFLVLNYAKRDLRLRKEALLLKF
jgi:hypothetical protein